jgi:uncharacterized protein
LPGKGSAPSPPVGGEGWGEVTQAWQGLHPFSWTTIIFNFKIKNMRSIGALLLILFMHVQTNAQTPANYDSVLAKKLHADAYGMKKYILVILKTGPVTFSDKTKSDSIFNGHMQNIQRLALQNKLILAGPLGKNDKNYEGIFVLNTESLKEAEKMLETDPAVHARVLAPELYLWYGSAAIQEIPGMHEKIQRSHF